MDTYTMLLKSCIIFSLIGFLKGTTTSTPECYTQPPGRINGHQVRTCQDKYAIIPENLFCQKNIQRHALTTTEKNEIETAHNNTRATVSPKAADMLPLKFNDGLGRTAQIWAEMCKLQPSKPLQRFRPGSYNVGENVFVSQTKMNWSDVINVWAKEKSAFTYGSKGNDPSLVSNYTQLVWAKTSAVGCSSAVCSGVFFYVCHYATSMDYGNISMPYEPSNVSCSKCPNNCTNSLCDCNGVICLNGANLNYTTCKCDCIADVKTYVPPTCELKCEQNGDGPNCGNVYKQSSCRNSTETMYHCPWMCDICPYAGKGYSKQPLPWERNRTECTTPSYIPSSTKVGGASPVQSMRTNKPQGTTSSQSAQTNGWQCGNGSSSTKCPQWAVVFVFILTFFYITK